MTMSIYFPLRRRILPWFLILSIVVLSSFTIIKAQSAGGLWGSVKEKIEPINDTIRTRYNRLSDRNRFITGACVGFGASRIVIGSEYTCIFIPCPHFMYLYVQFVWCIFYYDILINLCVSTLYQSTSCILLKLQWKLSRQWVLHISRKRYDLCTYTFTILWVQTISC